MTILTKILIIFLAWLLFDVVVLALMGALRWYVGHRQRATWRQELRREPRGFSLLEMLIVLAIIAVLLAVALPNPRTVAAMMNAHGAKQHVQTVAQAVSAQNLCNAQSVSCLGVAPLIPAPGTVVMGVYTYTFTGSLSWFTYTAIPVDPNATAYYIDSTNILRCSAGTAYPTSPICN